MLLLLIVLKLRLLLFPVLLLILTGVTIIPFASTVPPVELTGNDMVVPNVPLVTPDVTIFVLIGTTALLLMEVTVVAPVVAEEVDAVAACVLVDETGLATFLLDFEAFSGFKSGVFNLSCFAVLFRFDLPDGVASPNNSFPPESSFIFIPKPSPPSNESPKISESASKNFSSSKSFASSDVFALLSWDDLL